MSAASFPRSSNPVLNAMLTPTMRDFDRRQALAKSDPLLAALYWIEAAADRRISNDVDGLALRTEIRDRAREAIEATTGSPLNPLYR